MTDLAIWSDVHPVALEPLKAAKQAIGWEGLIVPRYPRSADDSHAQQRILAIGTRPPWLVDYALISERTSAEGWQAALRWALTDEEHPKATMILDQLRSIFGKGLREISESELASEANVRLYLAQSPKPQFR